MTKGMSRHYLVTFTLLFGLFAQALSITVNKNNAAEYTLNARNIGRALTQCLNQNQKLECLKIKVMHILEEALHDNSTWHYGDFVLVEKNELDNKTRSWAAQQQQQQQQQRSIGDRIGDKLLQLVQSRSLRLKVPTRIDLSNIQSLGAGFSDAVDDINADINAVVATTNNDDAVQAAVFGDDADDDADDDDDDVGVGDGIQSADEGRKKKDKDKTLAMMGGMTVVAMMAQMFLGKVILIAGASFVIAKVALLISLLTSIKNKSSGGHGSDHVIVTGGGGGHSHGHESSGWHRSMPYDYPKLEVLQDDEPEVATHHIHSEHGSPHSEYGSPPSHSDHGSSSEHHDSSYYSHKFSQHDVEDEFDRRAGFLKI